MTFVAVKLIVGIIIVTVIIAVVSDELWLLLYYYFDLFVADIFVTIARENVNI